MQHALFIVGPDGSGKTEVSTALSRLTGLPRFKCPSEKEWFTGRSFVGHLGFDLLLPDFVEQTGRGFISDRGWPCEWVYSRAFGRKTDDALIDRVAEKWRYRGGRVVILGRRSYKSIEDDLVPTDMLPRIHDLYQEFREGFSGIIPMITLYTDDFDQDDWAGAVADQILTWMAHDLVSPRDWTQTVLYDACQAIHAEAQAHWRDRAEDELEAASQTFRTMARAYLMLTSGNTHGALEELVGVDRGLLPNPFWEVLGRAW